MHPHPPSPHPETTGRSRTRHAAAAAAAITLGALLCGPAAAGIVAAGGSTAASGGVTAWTYALSLFHAGAAGGPLSPAAPVRDPQPHVGMLRPGAGFSVLDFQGYVAGSCSGPEGWVCTVRPHADAGDASHPGTVDLLWTYASGPKLAGDAAGLALGHFRAGSWVDGTGTLGWRAHGGPANAPAAGGAALWNVAGTVAGPGFAVAAEIPEPASLALSGLALLIAAGATRRGRRRAGAPTP